MTQLLKRLEWLKNRQNLIGLLTLIAEKHLDKLADYNREQLFEGLKASGEQVSRDPYTPFTIADKKARGKFIDTTIRLFDEGDLYQSIYPDQKGGNIKMEATDSKTSELKDRYGDDILGISIENQKHWIVTYIMPEFKTSCIAILTGSMSV